MPMITAAGTAAKTPTIPVAHPTMHTEKPTNCPYSLRSLRATFSSHQAAPMNTMTVFRICSSVIPWP